MGGGPAEGIRGRSYDGRKLNSDTMEKRFEFKDAEKSAFMTDAVIIVDKETGVNYLMVRSGYGAGLTPLIDADGKPIVTK